MRRVTVTWIVISILILIGVWYVWQLQSPSSDAEPVPTPKNVITEIAKESKNEEANKKTDPANETEQPEEKDIAEEIKETVVHVVESAIGLFIKKDTDIVAIGDSLTQGVGDTTENGGYVGIIENTLKSTNEEIDIKNYGKRGNRTDQLLDRLKQEEISESIKGAEIVLITIGANDIMKIVRENFTNLEYSLFVDEQVRYKDRLRKIMDTMLELNPDAKIYLIGFYNPFSQYFQEIEQLDQIIDNWNATGQSVTDEYETVSFIPTYDLFENTEEDLFYSDNFHPNTKGYELMAERVLKAIEPAIKKEDVNQEDGDE
ncbi:SGNH/GDSL hydrolase family protein [Radiobacillus kanasensis]|uniref:SGNH/GDSL hydrolase family protein n=1 Tax=Radiobacillus kanasensis TaxID=2844358 RepID=UPI001E572A9D|nr:SGNH/GDSL hydrolase family protein [Radiobacillus kanasensis]UFT99033.1 SGNH/GDSL hydrolase family protein [Radiobacillus kanasensis]